MGNSSRRARAGARARARTPGFGIEHEHDHGHEHGALYEPVLGSVSTAPPKPVTTSEHPERAREAGESKDESPHSFCKKGLSSFDSSFALAQDARSWALP